MGLDLDRYQDNDQMAEVYKIFKNVINCHYSMFNKATSSHKNLSQIKIDVNIL